VHHRTVAQALHVLSQALVSLAPDDLAGLLVGELPAPEALEACTEEQGVLDTDKVHKPIS
jgi:hypothetical protein